MRIITAVLIAGMASSFSPAGRSACMAAESGDQAAREAPPLARHVASIECIDPDSGDRFAPLGVAFDLAGDLYVVDGDNSSVLRIAGDATQPAFFSKCPGGGSDCQFVDILSDAGLFYVSDRSSGSVVAIDSEGRAAARWQVGPDVGGIGIGAAGQLFAAMTVSGSVVIVDLYGEKSPVSCPVFDSTEGSYPVDCLLASSNRVLVSDALSKKVLILSVLGRQIGSLDGFEFESPFGLARWSDRGLLVADSELGLVAVFDPDGRFIGTFGQGVLSSPAFIDARDDGTVAVADAGSMTIEVFRFDVPEAK
jgi:DNA-binding beta-propeller fold protein YncE